MNIKINEIDLIKLLKKIKRINNKLNINKLMDIDYLNFDNIYMVDDDYKISFYLKLSKELFNNKNGISFTFDKNDIYLIEEEQIIDIDSIFLSNYKNTLSLSDLLNGSHIEIYNKIDYSILPKEFKIDMYIGETGSGKTYNAILNNNNFIMAVPTRQLAYEIFLDYNNRFSNIQTGEISITNNKEKNSIVIYEDLNKEFIQKYDTLIIDEAHYISDDDRGGYLLEQIIYALSIGKKIIFLTATDSISKKFKELLHINVIKLKSYKKCEKIEIQELKKVKDMLNNENTQCLIFTKYIPDKYTVNEYSNLLNVNINDIDHISADIPTSERLQKQLDFRNGKIKVMISSNVLAQGVNFPADIVIIEYNSWDDWELIEQKIGRVGRPQFKNKGYYYLNFAKNENKMKKSIKNDKKNKKSFFYRDIYIYDLDFNKHEIPNGFRKYSDFKYSKRFLNYLKNNNLITEKEKLALNILNNEEEKILKIINKEIKKRY